MKTLLLFKVVQPCVPLVCNHKFFSIPADIKKQAVDIQALPGVRGHLEIPMDQGQEADH